MNASYEKVDKAGAVLFNVNPASPPQPVLTFWIVSAIALAGSVAGGSIGITLFFASLIAFGSFWTKKGPPIARYRKASSFLVSPAGIEICGQTIKTSDVHRLIIRNHIKVRNGTEIVVGYGGPTVSAVGAIGAAATGAAAAGLAISDRAGQKAEQRLQAVSYRVEVEAGGKATTLAGGLYEIVAFGIMSDVGNIMGLPAT